jgi:hypothetical protein
MHVNVIQGSDTAFNALVYKTPDQNLLSYLTTNMQNVIDKTVGLSQNFIANTKAMYDRFNSAEVINAGKALLYQTGMHFNQDAIYPLMESNIGTANLAMQRYIMANPELNNMYQKNMCYGFQETYFNHEPNTWGVERNDYTDVMDGMMEFDDEGLGYVAHYSYEDKREFSIFDNMSVLETWDVVARMLAEGKDPSDPDNGYL